MCYLKFLFSLLLVNWTSACVRSIRKKTISFENQPKFEYSIPLPNNILRYERNGDIKIKQNEFAVNYTVTGQQKCFSNNNHVLRMQYGTSPSFFSSSPEMLQPTMSVAIPFDCHDDTSFPRQIKEIVTFGNNSTSNSATVYDSVDKFLHSDCNTRSFTSGLRWKNSVQAGHANANISSKVLLFKSNYQSVTLRKPVTFNKNLMDNFYKLGSPFIEHQRQYYGFFQNFGSHFYSESTFGGVYVLAVWFNASSTGSSVDLSISENMRPVDIEHILTGGRPVLSRFMKYEGGLLDETNSFKSWTSTVIKKPGVICGSLEPFSVADSSNNNSKLVNSFQEAIQNEEMYYDLQLALKKLPEFIHDRRIRQFLEKKLRNEVKYIVIGNNMKPIIAQILSLSAPITIPKVEFETVHETADVIKSTFSTFPGYFRVCTRLVEPIYQVKNVKYSNGLGELRLYRSENCNGEFVKINIEFPNTSEMGMIHSFEVYGN